MKREPTPPLLTQRLQRLEQAIAENERRQRRLANALAKGHPVAVSPPRPVAAQTVSSRPAGNEPAGPAATASPNGPSVHFTHENAPIFMSGNLEELRGRSMTPAESRNRRRVLLFFIAVILVGMLYMLLRG